MSKNIFGIIGCGNMGEALIAGMIKSGVALPANIYVNDHDESKALLIKKTYKVTTASKSDIAKNATLIIIAVKPNHVEDLLKELTNVIDKNTIILSIAAGISIKFIESKLGKEKKVIRAMPNTPARVMAGVTALVRGTKITDNDMELAFSIFNSVGKALEVTEDKIEAITGISGSSPAFIFQIIEAMSDAGVQAGLDRKTAIELAAMTVMGSGKMVVETGLHPAVLKDMVTSPKGTTIEGVIAMERNGVRNGIIEAVLAAINKSKEMNK